MRVKVTDKEGQLQVTPQSKHVSIHLSTGQGSSVKMHEDPFLGNLVLTFHVEEFRQRVNSAGEIEITLGKH